jgi:hypothetical protein
MAVSIVKGFDGKRHEVQHPDGIPSSQIIKYAQRQIASAANAEDGFIEDVGKGLFAGGSQAALSSAAGITQWVGQAYGSESLLTAAEDMRMYGQGIADDIGLDEDFRQSFFGQVIQGIGQLPVTIGAGAVGFAVAGPVGAFGAAAITTGGQMSSEFLGDMEQTLGKGYTEFNPEEKSKALTGMLAQTALGTTLEMAAIGKAVRPLLKGLKGTGVTSKVLRKAIAKDKSALREITESMIAEGGTEALQGQSLDTLASLLYDEDRELITLDTLKRRTMEFGVGAVVGGVVSGGVQVIGTPGKTSTTAKDLNKPAQERAELTIPDSVTVTYKPIDGPVKTVSLAVDAGQDPMAAVERDLAGRYDPTYPIEINEVSSPVPVGPEQELDLPDQAPDPTQEQVPVEPEAAVKTDRYYTIPSEFDSNSTDDEVLNRRIGQDDLSADVAISDEVNIVTGLTQLEDAPLRRQHAILGAARGRLLAYQTSEVNKAPNRVLTDERADLYEAELEKISNLIKQKKAQMLQAEQAAPTPSQAPAQQQAPEPELSNIQARAKQAGMSEEQFRNEFPDVVNQLEKRQQAPAQQQAPAPATRTFSLPDPLKKGKPGYAQTQNITFASDLERATYSATTATQSDPAIRKRQQYRNLLKESGYSDTEINTMGREVRAQMKGQYKGKGSPIFVSLKQDVTAEASATYIPKRFVGDQAGKAPPFFQSFSPEQYDEGRFVDLETKQDLSNKTFEGGSIRIEGGRPILETSDNASETIINSKASEEGPLVRTNLFKQKAGWTWTKAPEGAPSTIVSVEQGPNHYYTLDFSSAKPLTLKTYPSKKSEPRGRPTTRGKVKLGNPVGEISIRGKKHTVYDRVTVGEPDVVAEAATSKPKAKKVTRDYDLLSSPFISNYSGPGPTDTSVPDYGSFHYVVSNPQQQELNAAIASGAVDYLADQVANEAAAMMNDPAIAAGIGWYGRMRQRLKEIFGNDIDIFTQLLGTTSAQTPVETNFRFSVDLYNRFKAGEFDANIKEYLKLYGQMKAGTLGDLLLKDKVKNSKGVLYTPDMIKKSEPSALLSSAAEHYNLEPAQTSGKKYGTNSYPALKALAQVWFNERLSKDKMTPKTPQFTMNLNGESLEATIDVWAARLLRRVIYAGQADSRILPSQETAVNNPDFALGQLVFRRAAQKLNMNPDDLQALVWFGEKQIWDRNGWTGAAGALKSSFDEPADVFYPVDGSSRSEADANLILDFLAKERLVKRDIEFPDAVTKTRQNENRKEYDQFLRQRVISDYLKSRGSGAVYESSSVESNRKRQVTRSINRLSSYTGKVSYKNGTGKEPKGSLKVVKRGPVLGEDRFARIAKANKDGNKFGSSVDVFKASDYKGYDLIITSSERGESVTMAISPDGELSSVTKSSNATAQDVDAAFDMAISTGKVKFLNGFETVLPIKYASYGFTPVARLKFNPEFQPDGWSTQTYRKFNGGQPDVVFMRFDGTVGSEYDRTGFPEVDTYEEGVRLANQEDVTAQATDTAVEDRGPRDTFESEAAVVEFIEQEFNPIAKKLNIGIGFEMGDTAYVAQYNVTQQKIQYNPMKLLQRTVAGVRAAMREEIIHAAMHNVMMAIAIKKSSMAEGTKVWKDFFEALGQSLTAEERSGIMNMYTGLEANNFIGQGSEYSRAVIQKLLYGEFTEQYVIVSEGGAAWNAIVQMVRSVQAYMAKLLGPMVKTNPEAAQIIVDTVELLKALDPALRPKSQDVVAQAYDATDKNTAKENAEAGERVGQDSSERIREQRKWFDGAFRETASKYLTPVITRLNRINPMFGRILQNLDTAIRTKSFKYRKQTEAFFNALNSIKGPEFLELKQLLFFSPTTEEANLPSNKLKSQRRDALLHKHGLLNMYRLDVEPILAQIYTEYSALGMPKIGYLEQYFPRVIKDLKGLINSYGHKAKRTFELLVNEENLRRSEIKDADGNPAPLPDMQQEELGRFFQDFLQGKFRLDLNGVKLPGNVKVREISLIPLDKLKYYDNPGIAFGKYTNNMTRAIESYKVVGDTRKGEGRLLGELGKLAEELFVSGQIDQADAYELKSLTELVTTQFAAENEILKSLGTLTYMATLINPGPVLVQIMDLYKVALYRGLRGVVSGTYRTVTGNRRFDIEEHFGIVKTQLSAEFEDPSVLQKALDFGLSRLVPFRQMDTAMKHASIEAAYDDFVRKAKAPVGSKKYNQILSELTITMGRKDALETIRDLQADKAMDSTLVKEALLAELLQRQPLTYLQVPEGYQTDPNKRLFYKLSTFMLLDLNYNRQEFMNDLGGPGKTLQQRTAALRRLTYMATLLTMFGLPSDLLDDWIAGKDTYIPEHVMNNMLGMFGLSRYTSTQVLEKGLVEGAVQRFTPPAINILMEGESSIRSWVKGDKELFEMKAWKFSPLSDVWYYKSGAGAESQKKWRKENLKEGVRPTWRRS